MLKLKFHKNILKENLALSLALGLTFAFSALLLLCASSAAILLSLKDPLAAIDTFTFCVLIISGAISGFCIPKFFGKNGMNVSFICHGILALILLACGLFSGGGIGFMNALCYAGISFSFSFFGKKRKRSFKPKKL